MTQQIEMAIEALSQSSPALHNTDFLLTWEKSEADLRAVVRVARALKDLSARGTSTRVFDGGLAVSIFRDKSTRTRFSFSSAASLLGLSTCELDEEKTQVSHGETVRETAVMISFATEVLGIRDDMYLGQGNAYMREVALALDEAYKGGALHGRPTIVNLQCDIDHPTQTMADLCHLESVFGSLDALRGKQIAVSWAHSPSYGKPLSVPQGLIGLLTRFGANVTLAHPEGYDLLPEVLEVARDNASRSGGGFRLVDSMAEAFDSADVVYPKSWAPLSVMQSRTQLLSAHDRAGLSELEKECLARNATHTDWECTREHMDRTRDKAALYMHCLPADISGVSCRNGEVSQDVFEQYRLETYKQASMKPFVIAAMIFLSRVDRPAQVLTEMHARRSSLTREELSKRKGTSTTCP